MIVYSSLRVKLNYNFPKDLYFGEIIILPRFFYPGAQRLRRPRKELFGVRLFRYLAGFEVVVELLPCIVRGLVHALFVAHVSSLSAEPPQVYKCEHVGQKRALLAGALALDLKKPRPARKDFTKMAWHGMMACMYVCAWQITLGARVPTQYFIVL